MNLQNTKEGCVSGPKPRSQGVKEPEPSQSQGAQARARARGQPEREEWASGWHLRPSMLMLLLQLPVSCFPFGLLRTSNKKQEICLLPKPDERTFKHTLRRGLSSYASLYEALKRPDRNMRPRLKDFKIDVHRVLRSKYDAAVEMGEV